MIVTVVGKADRSSKFTVCCSSFEMRGIILNENLSSSLTKIPCGDLHNFGHGFPLNSDSVCGFTSNWEIGLTSDLTIGALGTSPRHLFIFWEPAADVELEGQGLSTHYRAKFQMLHLLYAL